MTFWQFVADFFVNVGDWLSGVLTGWGLSPLWSEIILRALGGFLIATIPFVATIFFIWYARKIVARIQDRLGPNNSGVYNGPYGLLQSIADAIKILTKELIMPEGADKIVFILAPILMDAVAIAIWAVLPFGPQGMQGVDLNIGIFYILAISSLTLFAMLMAGWSSKNKYADVGAFRAASLIISYEVPQMLALLAPVMLAGTLSMQGLIQAQKVPFFIALPIPALIFFIAMTAEVSRLPFELAEADAEIVAGYQTEYSGMMFGAFYLGEFINNFTVSLIFVMLFWSGWQGPGVAQVPILGAFWLVLKSLVIISVLFAFWAVMPRMRIDHVLNFNWKFLTPLALVTVVVVALADKLIRDAGVTNPWAQSGLLFLVNVVIALGTYGVLRLADQRVRRQEAARRLAATQQQSFMEDSA